MADPADALLLPRARKVLKEMALVGQAEQMDWYLQLLTLNPTPTLTPTPTPKPNP